MLTQEIPELFLIHSLLRLRVGHVEDNALEKFRIMLLFQPPIGDFAVFIIVKLPFRIVVN